MSWLYLTEADVRALFADQWRSAVDDVRASFVRLADHRGVQAPRRRARGERVVVHAMSAVDNELDLAGWKVYATSRGAAHFLVGLYDATQGTLVALLEADLLGQLRTAATTLVAIEALRPGVAFSRCGLFGSGQQARSHARCLLACYPSLERIDVYSPRPERRHAFAEELSRETGCMVVAVDDPAAAVVGHSLIVTATSSREPLFPAVQVEPDALVCAVGSNWPQKAELSPELISQAGLVVCDALNACQEEAGDLIQAAAGGAFVWSAARELGDFVRGFSTAKIPTGVTIFKSVGLATEDVALAARLVERARRESVGHTLLGSDEPR